MASLLLQFIIINYFLYSCYYHYDYYCYYYCCYFLILHLYGLLIIITCYTFLLYYCREFKLILRNFKS